MAVGHYSFNDQTQHGRIMRRVFNAAETLLDEGSDVLSLLPQMIDGDGSNVSHFAYVVSKFGYPDTAVAKASWEEFQSMMGKLTGDGSVTFVNAAIKQAIAKHR